ncbi:MAG: phage tail tape measure C-terminal domain-containing protein [Alphaproteobacteria bacterium]
MAQSTVGVRLQVQGEDDLRRLFTELDTFGRKSMDSVSTAAQSVGEKFATIGRVANDNAIRVRDFGNAAIRELSGIAGSAASAATSVSGIAAAFGHQGISTGAAAIATSLSAVANSQNGVREATEESERAWVSWTAGIVATAAAAGVLYVAYQAVAAVLRETDDLIGGNHFALLSEGARAFADRLQDLSIKTGISTAELRNLSAIQKELGVNEAQATGIATHLSHALSDNTSAAEQARKAIQGLGVDLDDIRAADYPKVFDRVVAALNQYRDGREKAAAVKMIFGTDDLTVLKALANASPIWSETTERANAYADATALLIRRHGEEVEAIKNQKSWLGEMVASLGEATTRSEEFRNAQAYAAQEITGASAKYFAGTSAWLINFSGAVTFAKETLKGFGDYLQVLGHGVAPGLIPALEVPNTADPRATPPPSPEMLKLGTDFTARYDPAIAAAAKYRTEIEALDRLYKDGAVDLEHYIALTVKIGEAMTGDTYKAREHLQALREVAAAASQGPAAEARQAAISGAHEQALASGQPEAALRQQKLDELAANQEKSRNAAIFTLRQQAAAYDALTAATARGADAQTAAQVKNATASEESKNGVAGLKDWAAAYVQAQAAKQKYEDASKAAQKSRESADWGARIDREIAANQALTAAYRSGDQEIINNAKTRAEVAAKAEEAHKSTGIAVDQAAAALQRLNQSKRDAAREEWIVGIDREITANTGLSEAYRTGNIEVIRRAELARQAEEAHKKFGISVAEATDQLERQHAALAASGIAKGQSDFMEEIELLEKNLAARIANDPVSAQKAAIDSKVAQYRRNNPFASEEDIARQYSLLVKKNDLEQRSKVEEIRFSLDPKKRADFAIKELVALKEHGLEQKEFDQLSKQINRDYQRGQNENLMATETFAGGAAAAFNSYAQNAGNAAVQAAQVVSHSLQKIEDGLTGFILGTKTAEQAAKEFVASLIEDMVRLAVRQAIVAPLAGMAGGLLGSAFGGIGGGSLSAGVAHSGGIVGAPGMETRSAAPAWWINAPRYHAGGRIGLRPDEVPIIAQKGEMVLTAAQQRSLGQGSVVVNQTFNTAGASSVDNAVMERWARQIKSETLAAVANGRSRGGPFAKSLAG